MTHIILIWVGGFCLGIPTGIALASWFDRKESELEELIKRSRKKPPKS